MNAASLRNQIDQIESTRRVKTSERVRKIILDLTGPFSFTQPKPSHYVTCTKRTRLTRLVFFVRSVHIINK